MLFSTSTRLQLYLVPSYLYRVCFLGLLMDQHIFIRKKHLYIFLVTDSALSCADTFGIYLVLPTYRGFCLSTTKTRFLL